MSKEMPDNLGELTNDEWEAIQHTDLKLSDDDIRYLDAFKGVLNTIGKFYKPMDGSESVSVTFKEADSAFCTENNLITLPPSLVGMFHLNNLPKFCLYYHELGHVMWSRDMFNFLNKWKQMSKMSPAIAYDMKYLHLVNWIEDYWTEDKTKCTYPYLQDIIRCLGLMPVQYPMQDIEYAFNYYYVNKKPSPALTGPDANVFMMHLNNLLKLRGNSTFGKGQISMFNQNNINMQYAKAIIDFYNWCVAKGIFDDQKLMPPLNSPMNIVQDPAGQGQGQGQGNQPGQGSSGGGTSSPHSGKVGKKQKMVQVIPDIDTSNPIFNDIMKTERALVHKALSEYRHDTQADSLYGLFTSTYRDTQQIAKPNIPNFFNMNRLEDRMLFLEPGRTFNNVSIYRDISGSTHGSLFSKINEVCKYLNENIPIDKHFYLYSSGDISIMETDYQDWEQYDLIPSLYKDDETFRQFDYGTNSDAVADVISEQMSDKWMNIIVTDGDLHALYQRDNINTLLNNVAIISVGQDIMQDTNNYTINPNHYVFIAENDNDYMARMTQMLCNLKED